MIDGIITVKTDQIAAAIKDVFGDTRSILEPAGAVAVAGAKAYCAAHGVTGNVVAVTSVANMNFDRLRVISEIADQGGKEEATLLSIIPEKNGEFKRFVETVGDINISEFKYSRARARPRKCCIRLKFPTFKRFKTPWRECKPWVSRLLTCRTTPRRNSTFVT